MIWYISLFLISLVSFFLFYYFSKVNRKLSVSVSMTVMVAAMVVGLIRIGQFYGETFYCSHQTTIDEITSVNIKDHKLTFRGSDGQEYSTYHHTYEDKIFKVGVEVCTNVKNRNIKWFEL